MLYKMQKQMVMTLVLIYFGRPWFGHTIKKLHNIWDCWSRDMLNFYILFKGLGLVFVSHFVYDSSRKTFLLYSVNWLNFIVWLLLLLEILDNISIAIIGCPVCDVINFKINLSSFIKPFFCITKKSGQKFKYLKNEKSF